MGLKFHSIFNTGSLTLALLCNRQILIKHFITCLHNSKPSTTLFPNPHSSGCMPNIVASSCLQCCLKLAYCCLQIPTTIQAAGLASLCQQASSHLSPAQIQGQTQICLDRMGLGIISIQKYVGRTKFGQDWPVSHSRCFSAAEQGRGPFCNALKTPAQQEKVAALDGPPSQRQHVLHLPK